MEQTAQFSWVGWGGVTIPWDYPYVFEIYGYKLPTRHPVDGERVVKMGAKCIMYLYHLYILI